MEKKFDSPQQESLEIALETRRKIIEGDFNILGVVRSCFVIANNLSKKEDIKWIRAEMDDVWDKDYSYDYRKISLPLIGTDKFKINTVKTSISSLNFYKKNNKTLTLVLTQQSNQELSLRPDHCEELLDRIMNKCLKFLTDCISELHYSGYIQSIFENIKKVVDSKIAQLDQTILQELNSIYLNLISNNLPDWVKVPHSCRRILQFVADLVFPSSDVKYKTKDGREWDVKDNNFLNRLICYLDKFQNTKIASTETEFFEKYLREINQKVQDGEHKKEISKEDANFMAIHTYLILSEILKHK